MSYTRVNWEDYPDKTTPVNAENLNRMDEGIADLDDDMDKVRNGKLPNGTTIPKSDTFTEELLSSYGDLQVPVESKAVALVGSFKVPKGINQILLTVKITSDTDTRSGSMSMYFVKTGSGEPSVSTMGEKGIAFERSAYQYQRLFYPYQLSLSADTTYDLYFRNGTSGTVYYDCGELTRMMCINHPTA